MSALHPCLTLRIWPECDASVTGAVALVSIALALLLPAGVRADAAAVKLTATERAFVAALNEARVDNGRPPLVSDARLVRAARTHSQDMIDRRYFEHGAFAQRLARYGIHGGQIGENIGWTSGSSNTVATLVRMWLRSPGHRAVLLSPGFGSIGVGVARGAFKGWPGAVVVTTDFHGS